MKKKKFPDELRVEKKNPRDRTKEEKIRSLNKKYFPNFKQVTQTHKKHKIKEKKSS